MKNANSQPKSTSYRVMLNDAPVAWLTASLDASVADIQGGSISEQVSELETGSNALDAFAALDPAVALEIADDLDDSTQYVIRDADDNWVAFLNPSRFTPKGVTLEMWQLALPKASVEVFIKKPK